MALAGCGRKGALDPPPGGYILETQIGKTAVSRKGAERTKGDDVQYDDDGRPVAPTGPKKKLPGDWLIN